MTYQRLDPAFPESVVFGTKLGKADADRLTELARQAGMRKSAFIRAVLLDVLERTDTEPPDEAAA